MDLTLTLAEPTWKDVIRLNKHNGATINLDVLVRDVLDAARVVTDSCGCFIWTTRAVVYYCDCFGDNYRAYGFKTNLEGQLYYAFSSDINPVTKCRGWGLDASERINRILQKEALFLRVLQVSSLKFGGEEIAHDAFAQDWGLATAVARLLNVSYLRLGQGVWQ